MMFTLAILNQKGGVGKTTTAVTLAHGLALSGLRVLLVDLDAQGNVADALGLEKHGDLYRLLFDGSGSVAQRSGRDGLDVILGDKSTVEAKQRLTGMNFREMALRAALDQVRGYDVCVLDVAPGVDVLQVAALVACDKFLIPVALDHLAVVGAADALASAVGLAKYTHCGTLAGVLPTFWERQTREGQVQLETLVEQFGNLVWPPVPRDTKAREAAAEGLTLWEYAPYCRALRGVKIGDGHRGGYGRVLVRLVNSLPEGENNAKEGNVAR